VKGQTLFYVVKLTTELGSARGIKRGLRCTLSEEVIGEAKIYSQLTCEVLEGLQETVKTCIEAGVRNVQLEEDRITRFDTGKTGHKSISPKRLFHENATATYEGGSNASCPLLPTVTLYVSAEATEKSVLASTART
jgi:hypothetical protein